MLGSALLFAVVASGAGAARCEADFAGFASRYTESRAYQKAHALPRIRYSTVVDDGRNPHDVTRELRTAGSTVWQILPREGRRAEGLRVEVRRAQGPRAEIVVTKTDTDWQTVHRFANRKGCWTLVEVDDRSL